MGAAQRRDARFILLAGLGADVWSRPSVAKSTGAWSQITTPLARESAARKLPRVLSSEEIGRLLEAASEPKDKAMLSVAYGAGLRAMEVVALRVSDIDSKRMVGKRISKTSLLGDIFETAQASIALPVSMDSAAIAMSQLALAEGAA